MAATAFDKFDLNGKTALITGGGTGLSYHMTKALAESGATVLIAARREEVLQVAAARLNDNPSIAGRVRFHQVDLADRKSVATLAEYAIDSLGGVDIFRW